MTKFRALRFTGVAAAILFAAPVSRAGGPLEIVEPGQPYVWPNGGVGITFNPDQGSLGPFTNAEALAHVESAFETWEDVVTATASYEVGPPLPVDVDHTNFGSYIFADAPDGVSAVVFDADGAIFDELFGAGSGVLGFAGPEWLDVQTGTITEGMAFINGAAIVENPDPVQLAATLLHEFGHWNNLAHSQVNGSLFLAQSMGDPDLEHSGPAPNNLFPLIDLSGQVETMYPVWIPGSGGEILKTDDVAALSRLYPSPTFAPSTGTIAGRVAAPNGTALSGVNVIARNVDDPFADAISGLSGELTRDPKTPDFIGDYRLPGLTPGAEYVVYVDGIVSGEFSPTALTPLPGPEELYNGPNESASSETDDPQEFTPLSAVAGEVLGGVDVTFNAPTPGPITLDDDDALELPLPFAFSFCGQQYDSVFVSSNGNLTFESLDSSFDAHPRAHLAGAPRIAPLWADLVPNVGGTVAFAQTSDTFTVTWSDVPQYPETGSNTFSVTLYAVGGGPFTFQYGDISAELSLVGFSCGGGVVSGFEVESDLSALSGTSFNDSDEAATYEWFSHSDNDLAGQEVGFLSPPTFQDSFEPNDSAELATPVQLPFNSADSLTSYSALEPGDVDFYTFPATAGERLLVETAIGPVLDSLIGIFDSDGTLLASDDDGLEYLGASQILYDVPSTGNYFVAVTTFPDEAFIGEGESSGRYTVSIRTFRGTEVLSSVYGPGEPLDDDDYGQVAFPGFTFPFQGARYSSVFVSSNGNLTFGAPPSDPASEIVDSVPDLSAFLEGPPRFAPLWRDLTPFDPSIDLEAPPERKAEILAETSPDALTIHYIALREFTLGGTNTASIRLQRDGMATISYGATNREYALVGFTPGGGAVDPGPTDLSETVGHSVFGTRYEQFSFDLSTFGGDDLSFDAVTFEAPPTPCSQFCANPQDISWTGSYQGQPLGTGAICRQTTQAVSGGNCGNFAGGRTLSVNGVPMPCTGGNWSSVPAKVNGGYCVQTTAGNHSWAFVTLW